MNGHGVYRCEFGVVHQQCRCPHSPGDIRFNHTVVCDVPEQHRTPSPVGAGATYWKTPRGRHAAPVCGDCDGDGQVANDTDGTPWGVWAALTPPANLAVTAGIVKPVPCPSCNGTGNRPGD